MSAPASPDPELRSHRPERRSGCTVVVCRGCCCGNTSKHPHTDHDEHIQRLAEAVAGQPGSHLRISSCLGMCSWSNVVVVRPRGKDAARRARWLGQVLHEPDISALCDWISDGGPDRSEIPVALERLQIPMREETPLPGR